MQKLFWKLLLFLMNAFIWTPYFDSFVKSLHVYLYKQAFIYMIPFFQPEDSSLFWFSFTASFIFSIFTFPSSKWKHPPFFSISWVISVTLLWRGYLHMFNSHFSYFIPNLLARSPISHSHFFILRVIDLFFLLSPALQ